MGRQTHTQRRRTAARTEPECGATDAPDGPETRSGRGPASAGSSSTGQRCGGAERESSRWSYQPARPSRRPFSAILRKHRLQQSLKKIKGFRARRCNSRVPTMVARKKRSVGNRESCFCFAFPFFRCPSTRATGLHERLVASSGTLLLLDNLGR